METKELARFIEASVKSLYESDSNETYFYQLDEELGLYVGWGDGFDESSEYILHSKSNPRFGVSVKIAEWNAMDLDYEWLYMPYERESEDVYDTDMGISPNEDYDKLAEDYLREYNRIREGLDSGELTW